MKLTEQQKNTFMEYLEEVRFKEGCTTKQITNDIIDFFEGIYENDSIVIQLEQE